MIPAVVLLVASWLVMLAISDIRTGRLPNTLTIPGAVLIISGAVLTGRGVAALAGAAALGGGYLLVHLIAPAGMGAGDVKLAVGLGALCGAAGGQVWLLAALGAPLLTVLACLLLGRRVLPHGPAMCLATALAVGCAGVTG